MVGVVREGFPEGAVLTLRLGLTSQLGWRRPLSGQRCGTEGKRLCYRLPGAHLLGPRRPQASVSPENCMRWGTRHDTVLPFRAFSPRGFAVWVSAQKTVGSLVLDLSSFVT